MAAPPADAWQSLLSAYQAAWARRHPLLGLALHPAAPGWVAAVRGGSMLGVLRQASPVEALAAGPGRAVGELAAAQLPAQLQAVHACAGEVGALLGPLAQDAFLWMLLAGE